MADCEWQEAGARGAAACATTDYRSAETEVDKRQEKRSFRCQEVGVLKVLGWFHS
jgi:hypothetical protein